MPISTGLQLAGIALIGVFIFGEWHSITARLWEFLVLPC